MKRTLVLPLLFTLVSSGSQAQYYYKDIVSNNQLQEDMNRYRENKIRNINIKSFEGDGTPSEGFFAQKKIAKDYSRTQLLTRSYMSAPSVLTTYFNNKGQVLQTKLKIYHDIIVVIPDSDKYIDRSNYLTKVYWSKSEGLIRYDKKDNVYWELTKKYSP